MRKKNVCVATSKTVLFKSRGPWAQIMDSFIFKLSGFTCSIGSETVKIVLFGDHGVEGLKGDKITGHGG